MSLEQYKDANRKELWEILQIQVERIAEFEKENKELQECFDECYEELRLTRDAIEFAPCSCDPEEQYTNE